MVLVLPIKSNNGHKIDGSSSLTADAAHRWHCFYRWIDVTWFSDTVSPLVLSATNKEQKA